MAIMSKLNNYDIVDNIARNGVTTTGTGAAYVASVPGITSLKVGANFIMIPNVVSTSTTPTLNVNGLGAKQIRRRISNSTSSIAAGSSAGWLAASKPVKVVYDGTYWIADIEQPNASDLYGTVPVSKGGTGVTTFTGTSGLIHNMFDGNLTGANYIPVFTDSWADGGYMSKQQLRNALGLGNTLGAVPIANGGTGGTTAATARTNLDVYSKSESNSRRLYASPVTIGANIDNMNIDAKICLETQADLKGTDHSYRGDADILVNSSVLSTEDNISSLYSYVTMSAQEVKIRNSGGEPLETKYAYAMLNTDEGMHVQSSDCGLRHTHLNTGNTVSFGVGSGGTNRGVYDTTGGSWIIYNGSDTNTRITQPLIVQGHSTAIGSCVGGADATDVALSANVWKNVKSVSLPAGTWILVGECHMNVKNTGKFGLSISGANNNYHDASVIYAPNQASAARMNVSRILNLSATTTIYLNAVSSVASTTVTHRTLWAARIA